MTYKTKISIAIGIGFAFIIVMAVIMVVFVSNNSSQSSNSNQEVTNSVQSEEVEETPSLSPNTEIEMELSEVYSLGIQSRDDGDYLVKLSEDLESEDVVNLDDIDGFIGYDYYEETVYLAFNQVGNAVVYTIDLNDNSDALLAELDYNVLNSFYVNDGYIYCVTVNNSIYRYNIEEESGEEFIVPDDDTSIVNAELDKENSVLYYMQNVASGDEETAYIYSQNLADDTNEELLSAGYTGYGIDLQGDYLLCNLLDTSFFMFDIENKSLWELGTAEESPEGVESSQNYAFLDNYIAFCDGQTIKIANYDGVVANEELYSVSDDVTIVDITALTLEKLQITTDEEEDNVSVIDFETSTIDTVSDSYTNILIIR